MKDTLLYAVWGGMYILCVGLGTIADVSGIMQAALILVSVIFFVPGALLLYNGYARGDRKAVLRIRWICIASLSLTTLGLMTLLLCAASLKETAVTVAYDILLILSSPMMCSQYWILSLCLWAGLLWATFLKKLPR